MKPQLMVFPWKEELEAKAEPLFNVSTLKRNDLLILFGQYKFLDLFLNCFSKMEPTTSKGNRWINWSSAFLGACSKSPIANAGVNSCINLRVVIITASYSLFLLHVIRICNVWWVYWINGNSVELMEKSGYNFDCCIKLDNFWIS